MKRLNAILAALACSAKFAVPPACAYVLNSSHGPVRHCETAHLSHGRGSAGEFLPDAVPPFAMGAAAEVATMVLSEGAAVQA